MVGFASDGASNMVGSNNGLGKKLKEQNPFIITTHCIAHRLNLANQQAFSAVTDLVRFEDVIKSVYNYFAHSSKRYSALEEFQKDLDIQNLKLSAISPTRWSSIINSLYKI